MSKMKRPAPGMLLSQQGGGAATAGLCMEDSGPAAPASLESLPV